MVVSEILVSQRKSVIALFDNDLNARSVIEGVALFHERSGFQTWRKSQNSLDDVKFLIAIGRNGADRLMLSDYLQSQGIAPGILIAKSAAVSPSASIKDGSQILEGAIVAARASIGRQCIVNNGAQVDHESVIGDGVHLAPGAILCGCVEVGNSAFLGAGCVILPRIKVGDSAIIGAGAVVTKDVPPNAVVVGNPAKEIDRTRRQIN